MITNSSPVVRERLCSEREVAARLMETLKEKRFSPAGVDPLKDALVQVFARYCELLTDRLNRIPDTHHHAFVSMLGAQPAPAIPARVPLTFTPVKSPAGLTAVVPRYTQVSALAENESGLVVFETSKDLMLVQAEVTSAMAVDEQRLVYADVTEMVSPASAGFRHKTLFDDALPMTRALHIGAPIALDLSNLTRLRLKIDLEYSGMPSPDIEREWGIQSKDGFQRIEPEFDTTLGLTRSGELGFSPPKDWPSRKIGTGTFPWLTCRLQPTSSVTPKNSVAFPVIITQIEVSAFTDCVEAPLKDAFHGGIPLDISQDFYPLGERPRFGDVFYAVSDSFVAEGTEVEIDIKLTNPVGAEDSPIPAVTRKGNPQLRWECHTANGWAILDCADGTQALTQDGKLSFTVPNGAARTTINSVNGGCIRARMTGGVYISVSHTDKNELLPQMAPPSIAEMKVTSSKKYGPARPECSVIESNFKYTSAATLPFAPFPLPEEQDIVVYLGLCTPDPETSCTELRGRTMSFFTAPCDHGGRAFNREKHPPVVTPRWQVRGTTGWIDCTVNDLTLGFRNPGIVEVRVPEGTSSWNNSTLDQNLLWLRINWNGQEAEEEQPPCLRRLLLNTVMATQTMRLENELLGSGNGRPKQEFHALHSPIIGNVVLEVREHGGEQRSQSGAWREEEPRYALGSMKISSLPINEVWVPWHEVPDFLDSSSDSRHYTINRLTGRIQFGDGMHGFIPPVGANNIRLREYHTGGGKHGNQPANSLTRLHTTVPYVESVINLEPSVGGQDMEDINLLNHRAVAQLRHRDRAICMDDYADLALKASPEVGFAACVGARHILSGSAAKERAAGVISVIIVPRSDTATLRPQPSYELMRNVKAFLDARKPVGVDLVVAGPEYVAVSVIAEISWKPGCSTTGAAAECEKRVADFLHPLTGGPDGGGWGFGRRPHASDIYPLLGGIEGVNHIRALEVKSDEDRRGLLSARTFLICSGKHDIQIF